MCSFETLYWFKPEELPLSLLLARRNFLRLDSFPSESGIAPDIIAAGKKRTHLDDLLISVH